VTPADGLPAALDELTRSPRDARARFAHGQPTGAVAFSADRRAAGRREQEVDVWLWNVVNPRRPKLIAKLTGFGRWAEAVAFTSNSQNVMAGSAGGVVRIWSTGDIKGARTGTPPAPIGHPLTGPTAPITAIALSPDGKMLAAATTNAQVWFWGVGTPNKPGSFGSLTEPTGTLNSLAFSPTDNTLAAGGAGRVLRLWSYRPYVIADRICSRLGTPLTQGEWKQYVAGLPYRTLCPAPTPSS